MLAPLSRRGLLRPKALAAFTLVFIVVYMMVMRSRGPSDDSELSNLRLNHLLNSYNNAQHDTQSRPVHHAGISEPGRHGSMNEQGSHDANVGSNWAQSGLENNDEAKDNDLPSDDRDNQTWENIVADQKLAVNKMTGEEMKEQWKEEHAALANKPGHGAIYGNTLATLSAEKLSHLSNKAHLTPVTEAPTYSVNKPYAYNPYPNYNGEDWLQQHAKVVACDGPGGNPIKDIQVFRGHPQNFPEPGFGSYETLGLDGNLCFERETRLGMYGLASNATEAEIERKAAEWDKISWGDLQEDCVAKNKNRYDLQGEANPYVKSGNQKRQTLEDDQGEPLFEDKFTFRRHHLGSRSKMTTKRAPLHTRRSTEHSEESHSSRNSHNSGPRKEERTALLLRSYTGKKYSENDKQVIRSLVSELSLRTGGRYQVFLFVQVKDTAYAIWDDATTYQYVLQESVPKEFRDMTILWNDEATQAMYTALDSEQAAVHVSQWLSVQKFAQEFPEFDYIWNWEMDARITGHNYDIIEKLASFAKRQPRRGLWERNERFYIPAVHGKYDTDFRQDVEQRSKGISQWGPPDLPFVKPVGPHPPTARPEDDNYEWGVGEEADLITLSPIFNPKESGWVSVNELWGYNDSSHATKDLPRRATIITHSRLSKRLLDVMHMENLRGNHISAEMATQTTAFLHGLKAVYAPIPVWFDRAWTGKDLTRWFNPGPNGTAGGHGCAMAWGQEARYAGSTWYFRADPPQRLYLNWMGWEDTGLGGPEWEEEHGRPCLPPMIIHPVKDIEPTEPGYQSESKLPYE